MALTVVRWWFAVPVFALAISLFYGIAASREAISIRKGKMVLLASVCGGVGVGLFGGVLLLLQNRLPLVSADGIIESVSVHPRLSYIWIRVPSGERLALKALDRSPLFHPQERIEVQYQAYTGVIMRAQFLAPDGRVEGSFRSTSFIGSYAALVVGALIIMGSVKRYRRDPEAAEENTRPYQTPHDSVDTLSLLGNLSKSPHSEVDDS